MMTSTRVQEILEKVQEKYHFSMISKDILKLITAGWYLLEALKPANEGVIEDSLDEFFSAKEFIEVPESLDDLPNDRIRGLVRNAPDYFKNGVLYISKKFEY